MNKKLKAALPVMFDVEPEHRNKSVGYSSKKKDGGKFKKEFRLDEIGINAAWKRDGHVIKNRNNTI